MLLEDKRERPRDKKTTDPYTGNCQNQQNDKRKVHSKGKKSCGNCPTRHPFGACPAHGKTCNICGNLNHHARCCRSTMVKQSTFKYTPEADEEILCMFQEEVEKFAHSVVCGLPMTDKRFKEVQSCQWKIRLPRSKVFLLGGLATYVKGVP
ncbi:hypothetical protein HOLleu_25937 [Holothuria leucospilota]|uniref:Uncharacterized protein n=1 Tax=Holothuria leucospilota TaxID=206669 RepID=A0A9Q1BTR1_HOLLE|nr:hypothetical protein HOLleu_25937 [Holothuria leucospilota]